MLEMLKEADRQALKTFIGTALIKFASGIIGIWGTVNIYFFSYIKNSGTQISSQANSQLLLCVIIPSAFAMLASTTLSRKFGYKNVIRICGFAFATLPFLINFKLTTFTLGLFYLLVPITCLSVASVPILNCLWSHFPKHLNKVSGSAVLFFSLGTVVFNLIFTFLVNPNNEKAKIQDDNQAFFESKISDNVFTAANTIIGICGICYICGSFMISKKDDKQTKQGNSADVQLQEESPRSDQDLKKQQSKENIAVEAPIRSQKLTLNQTLFDKKFIVLFCISLFIPLYIIYLMLYMKLIFMPIINDDHYLATCAISITVSAIFGAPFWGFIADRTGFKQTLLVIIAIDFIIKILGLFCQQKWNIILLYFMLGFNDKGIITIIGPGLIEIFGLEMATELIPYKGMSIFIAYMTIPIVQIMLSSIWTYQHILMLLLVFSGVALGLSVYFNSKIRYEKHDKFDTDKLTAEVL